MSTTMVAEETKTMDEESKHDDLPEWVRSLPNGAIREEWPPRAKAHSIDWELPTNEIYFDPDYKEFTPEFKAARQKLDYSYHRNPAKSRQELQDVILGRVVRAALDANQQIQSAIAKAEESKDQEHERRPWIVFSAGPMGVGKGYVMTTLNERGLFPLDRFLKIDPDMLKFEIPEMAGYLQQDPASAATKLHRESTQMADVLLEHALQKRIPTLVDGSLRDVDYYRSFMERIRREFPEFQLAILHVTASPEIIRSRAQSRAEKTGRAVPEQLLEASIAQVPESVKALSPHVDVVFTIANEEDQPLKLVSRTETQSKHKQCKLLGSMTCSLNSHSTSWNEFRDVWWTTLHGSEKKVCKFMPKWCNTMCPGKSQYKTCWMDKACIKAAKAVYASAYPSFCPNCTLAGGQCGICIHGQHWCQCPDCGPGSDAMKEKQKKKGHCSLTSSMNSLLGRKKP